MKTPRGQMVIGKNLLTFRHRLKMTQSEFIEMFLTDEAGKSIFSVAKLSNIETKGNHDESRAARIVSDKLGIDAEIFEMEPPDFERNIDTFLDKSRSKSIMLPAWSAASPQGKSTYSDGLLEALSNYLAENISSGKLRAGDRLPGDRTLAELLGISRSAVREALKVLSAIGVVNILPGSGVYLAKNTQEIFTLSLSWTFLLSTDSNQNVYQLRMILERETVRIATQKRGEPSFAPIREAVRREAQMLAEKNYSEFMKCDADFHMGIAYCAGNEVLSNLLFTCRKILSLLNAYGMSTIGQMQEIQREHSELFSVMERGDSELAQKLIVEHLQSSELRYQGRK